MDEKPYQLLGETREPMRPGDTQKADSECVRRDTCSIFVFVEPLGGVRHVSMRKHHTAIDWAKEIKYPVDVSNSDCDKIILVMDNLNIAEIELNVMTRPSMPVQKACFSRDSCTHLIHFLQCEILE